MGVTAFNKPSIRIHGNVFVGMACSGNAETKGGREGVVYSGHVDGRHEALWIYEVALTDGSLVNAAAVHLKKPSIASQKGVRGLRGARARNSPRSPRGRSWH